MESNSERQRMRIDGEDRLSALPDEILFQIISYLPTKHAVGTTVLSSRWKNNLWTYLSNLEFNQFLLLHPDRPFNRLSRGPAFVEFVDRVLRLCDAPNIRKFVLRSISSIDPSRLTAWICEVIRRGVVELDLDVNFREPIEMPQCLYTCGSLEALSIRSYFHMRIPASGCFSRLKVLHIDRYFPQHDDAMAEKLFCSCPVLEDLSIDATLGKKCQVTFNITAPMLKRLRMHLRALRFKLSSLDSCQVVVCAPNLEYLDLWDNFLAIYNVGDPPLIDKADIDVGWCYNKYGFTYHAEHAFQLLESISSVGSLSLSARTSAALSFAHQNNLPLFHNLTRLELGVADCCEWKLPLRLLHNLPTLELLILKKEHKHADFLAQKINWRAPKLVPSFLLSHLKVIEVWGFEGLRHELRVVKYLLKHAKGLSKMTIDAHRLPVKEELMFQNSLSKSTRASKTCQIEFSRDIGL